MHSINIDRSNLPVAVDHFTGAGRLSASDTIFTIPAQTCHSDPYRIVNGVKEGLRHGAICSGNRFPNGAQLANLLGENPADCIEVVNELLRSGMLLQRFDGSLYVAKLSHGGTS